MEKEKVWQWPGLYIYQSWAQGKTRTIPQSLRPIRKGVRKSL